MRKAQQTRSLVAAWFDFMPERELGTAKTLHKTVRAIVPELTEAIRQGTLLMSLNGEPLLAIAPGEDEVQLLIFNGVEVEDAVGPLEGASRRQRLLKFASGGTVDVDQVAAVARVSAELCRRQQAPQGH